jgi:hypothetical protein
MIRHEFSWSHGHAEITSTAAMLSRCVLELPNGPFEPLARAEWAATGTTGHPGHLRELGGEFVGLPFGDGGIVNGIVEEWAGLGLSRRNPISHGPAGDEEWELTELRECGATLRLDYPQTSDISWLERRVDGVPGEPTLQLSLRIAAWRDTKASVGLHPIVRLPERAGALRVRADFALGLGYPATLHPGTARVVPGSRFTLLSAVPVVDGTEDFGTLPLADPAEEILQLCGVRGPIHLDFLDDHASLCIEWDTAMLPSAQLWLSDRVLQEEPWNGRYRGLGIEPIASAFDLAEAVSIGQNPIEKAGYATSISLTAAQPVTISYRLAAKALTPHLHKK